MTPQPAPPVLVLAPAGRDAILAASILQEAGLAASICQGLDELVTRLDGAAAAVVAEEAMAGPAVPALVAWIAAQPTWSDFPFVLLVRRGHEAQEGRAAEKLSAELRNVTLLERPFRPATLASATRSAVAARQRQYQARDAIVAADAAAEALRRHREQLEALVAERTQELEEANARLRQAAEDRDQAEAALLHAQKLDAIGQLTGGLAHDFNNLLQAVLASFEMIRRRGHDPAQLERLVAAGTEAARRGATLTAQLLAFSRKQKLDLAPIPAAPLVAGMQDLLARALGPEVELRLDLQDDAGAALADATQLELAVLNLAINARDAMPKGGALTVSVRSHYAALSPDMAAGRYVAIAVSDTGEGMPPEVAARAFEPFFTTKGVGKGTGLGLSQVYGIARQSGGTARIRSAPDKGTTVTILLPVAAGPAALQGRDDEDARRIPPPTVADGALVLVVDDDPAVRQAIAGWLVTLGYRVAEAADGRTGLAELDRLAPEALLVDYAMPGLTGTEVAEAARQRRPDLPVILATGYSSDASLGGWPTLRKPFRIEELAAVLGKALGPSAPITA